LDEALADSLTQLRRALCLSLFDLLEAQVYEQTAKPLDSRFRDSGLVIVCICERRDLLDAFVFHHLVWPAPPEGEK
jgi:hypothetical protein